MQFYFVLGFFFLQVVVQHCNNIASEKGRIRAASTGSTSLWSLRKKCAIYRPNRSKGF